jgi:hypothetical protein
MAVLHILHPCVIIFIDSIGKPTSQCLLERLAFMDAHSYHKDESAVLFMDAHSYHKDESAVLARPSSRRELFRMACIYGCSFVLERHIPPCHIRVEGLLRWLDRLAVVEKLSTDLATITGLGS